MTFQVRRGGAAVLVALAVVSCTPSEPRLTLPQPIESFCGWRVALGSSIDSVISSVDSRAPGTPSAGLSALRVAARAQTGAVAHWPAGQLLDLPAEAHAVGANGDYVTMRAAAVVGTGGSAATRPVEIEIREHDRWRWITLQAFDKQDVCDTGTRSL